MMELHGGTPREDLLDFSISVNPYTPAWKEKMISACDKSLSRYNHVEWIEEDFKKVYGEDTVILAGATEAFQIIGFTFMNKADVVIPVPSYGELERVSAFRASKIHHSQGSLLNAFKLSKKLALNGKRVVLIFSNPNNPTGLCAPKETKKWIEEVENVGVTVIVDEAFMDFVKNPVEICTPRTVRIRSFTKSYGMPGIRVGYVKTGLPNFRKNFLKYRAPWGIGACGYNFITYLLEDGEDHLKKTMPLIWKERERFLTLGMRTDSNFGMIKVENAKKIQEKLDALGIHVRNCESFGLKQMIRVSIRTKGENDVLFEALQKLGFFRKGG